MTYLAEFKKKKKKFGIAFTWPQKVSEIEK